MKKISYAIFVLFALSMVAFGCKSDSSDVKDQARESLAQTPTPQASTPATNPSTPAIPSGPTTSIEFEEMEFDFGTVEQGEKVSHIYRFRNTGSEPLIITDAKASCGCTVPKKPTEPIPPGEVGELTVEFDSRGKSGPQNRTVTVTANTNPPQTLVKIKGEVAKPAS